MYTVYIPKYQGEKPDFLITKVLSKYMDSTGYTNNIILSSPGYMSTTNNTIDEYLSRFENEIINLREKINMCIFNGMNGTRKTYPSGPTIREAHENRITRSVYLNLISVNCSAKIDHRKMMFFIRFLTNTNNYNNLNLNNYQEFLRNIEVHGVLIGSSNQSLNTYFGGSHSLQADKGEADILMFTEDDAAHGMLDSEGVDEMNNIIISKSMRPPLGGDAEYLKTILQDFLKNSLIL
ncbi:MAG: hypothetical protein ACI4JJ_07870 [Huintestinicola sp.]